MNDKVHVLGVEYSIRVCAHDDDEDFKSGKSAAYNVYPTKEIVIGDLKTWPCNATVSEKACGILMLENCRHEIIHAFLNESGLSSDSLIADFGWAKNEEMVDWIAMQFSKMLSAFQEADCL